MNLGKPKRHHISFPAATRLIQIRTGQDVKQEVREFFGVLIDENLAASHLIDSDFVVINSALAVHYGINLPPTGNAEF